MDQTFVIINPSRINYIDPRIKLVHTVIAGLLLFIVRSNEGVLVNAAFMAGILFFLRLRSCALRLITYVGVLYLFVRFLSFFTGGAAALIGVSIYILFKFSPVIGVYYMMTQSVSASELVNALEKLKLPRSITITLAVTLRFMPTIGQEMTAIRDSMKIRNIPLNLLSVLKAPLMMLEYVIVPLMMRFVKVAEELAAAAVVRGIEKPGKRGSMSDIKLRKQDYLYLLIVLLFAVFLCSFESGAIL